jgi:hypothetical protein
VSGEATCYVCERTFTEPRAAAEHWRDTFHQPWSIPRAWLDGRPWTLAALFRAALAELER